MPRQSPALKQLPSKTTWTGKRFVTDHRDHLPLPTGRYAKVGCRDILIGYSRKTGVLLRLFYPHSTDADHDPQRWSSWFVHPSYRASMLDVLNIKSELMRRIMLGMNKEQIYAPVLLDAKPAREDGHKFPIVIFSHGIGGFRNAYVNLCIEIASHGFVVAAVEHRDNSGCLSFYARNINKTDGDDVDDGIDYGEELEEANYTPLKPLEPMPNSGDLEFKWIRHRYYDALCTSQQSFNFRHQQVNHRVGECSRALDLLEVLNAGKEIENLLDPNMNVLEFEGLLDLDKVSVMGHSFGGATALKLGATDARIKVVVALDTWTFPVRNEAFERILQPAIMLNTETLMNYKNIKGKLSEMLNGHDGEHRQAWTLNRSTHAQQSDIFFVINNLSLRVSTSHPRWRLMSSLTVRDLSAYLSLQFIAKYLDIKLDKNITEYIDKMKHRIRPTYSNSA